MPLQWVKKNMMFAIMPLVKAIVMGVQVPVKVIAKVAAKTIAKGVKVVVLACLVDIK